MKLSANQMAVLQRLDDYKPLAGSSERGWQSCRLYDALTVRSLIRRGLVRPSSDVAWMIKHNLDSMSVTITETGIVALAANKEQWSSRRGNDDLQGKSTTEKGWAFRR